MQYWPRKRASRSYSRLKFWPNNTNSNLCGFCGYKVGMTHVVAIDNKATSKTKGKEIFYPITLIDCPPIKTLSVRFYKNSKVLTEVISPKIDKDLKRKITLPKNISKKIEDVKDFDNIKLVVHTQPKLSKLKKRPEIFEIGLCGTKDEQLAFAKEKLGKEIDISEVFKPGQQIDVCGVTKGKGFQGPVKRFGVSLRTHKSEKSVRNPGSLGPWCGQRHIMYRVAHAGQMGYHQRRDLNKVIIKIDDGKKFNPKGGFKKYGLLNNNVLMVKGSVMGSSKRLITLIPASRPRKNEIKEAPSIKFMNVNVENEA